MVICSANYSPTCQVRDQVWPLAFIFGQRKNLCTMMENTDDDAHITANELPDTFIMPPSWHPERLQYSSPQGWWDAAERGIAVRTLPSYP